MEVSSRPVEDGNQHQVLIQGASAALDCAFGETVTFGDDAALRGVLLPVALLFPGVLALLRRSEVLRTPLRLMLRPSSVRASLAAAASTGETFAIRRFP